MSKGDLSRTSRPTGWSAWRRRTWRGVTEPQRARFHCPYSAALVQTQQHQNRLHPASSSWQISFAESFNSGFKDEFLNTELFTTVAEAQGLAHRWRGQEHTIRPHAALAFHYSCGVTSATSETAAYNPFDEQASVFKRDLSVSPGRAVVLI
jgi:hypothetical protein